MKRRDISAFGRSIAIFGILLTFLVTPSSYAQVPTDYLVQKICLNASGGVTSNDPVGCAHATRKLQIGEALPYHKTDFLGLQISDSYPIADRNGISKAVQTYFFTANLNTDPRFPNMPHFYPYAGGYNIVGADASYIYFRGTFDQSGGWQPWWTSNCQAKGWLQFPNSSGALSYGSAASPTQYYPSCPGAINTAASTVEWNRYNFTYATGKTLDSLAGYHFAPGYGALEINYYTQQYGVTRWEAWIPGTNQTPQGIKNQCPNVAYNAVFHGTQFYMADCRDWSKISPLTTFWDPDGASPSDPYNLIWQVDPLYNSQNLLKNTWIGGPYTNYGSPQCSTVNWNRINTPAVVNWVWDPTPPSTPSTSAPFTTHGNCALRFSTPAAFGGQAIYQQVNIAAGGNGTHTFGAMLWAPYWHTGQTKPLITLAVIQRDSSGGLLDSVQFNAHQTNLPAYFAATFQMNPATTSLTFTIYPKTPNTEFEITGAWAAKMP